MVENISSFELFMKYFLILLHNATRTALTNITLYLRRTNLNFALIAIALCYCYCTMLFLSLMRLDALLQLNIFLH